MDEPKSVGAQPGNTNSAKQRRLFGDALRRALTQDKPRLEGLVEKLIGFAEAGEGWAFGELLNRLDGKVPQQLQGSDDPDAPEVKILGRIVLVRPD